MNPPTILGAWESPPPGGVLIRKLLGRARFGGSAAHILGWGRGVDGHFFLLLKIDEKRKKSTKPIETQRILMKNCMWFSIGVRNKPQPPNFIKNVIPEPWRRGGGGRGGAPMGAKPPYSQAVNG